MDTVLPKSTRASETRQREDPKRLRGVKFADHSAQVDFRTLESYSEVEMNELHHHGHHHHHAESVLAAVSSVAK
jgi:hypothetical protein